MPVGWGLRQLFCICCHELVSAAFEVPRRVLVRVDSWLERGA